MFELGEEVEVKSGLVGEKGAEFVAQAEVGPDQVVDFGESCQIVGEGLFSEETEKFRECVDVQALSAVGEELFGYELDEVLFAARLVCCGMVRWLVEADAGDLFEFGLFEMLALGAGQSGNTGTSLI